MTIHQRRHFNKNVKIDNVSVGGLTAEQALKNLQDNPQSPKIYVNNELVFTDKQSVAKFSSADEQKLKMHYIVSILSSHHLRQRTLRLSLKMLIKMKYQRLIKQSVKR